MGGTNLGGGINKPPKVQIKEQQIKQIKQLSKERLIEAMRKMAGGHAF